MFKLIKGKNVQKFIFFILLLIVLNGEIICNNNITCFEYSCEECNSTEYGNCIKCRSSWKLIDGTCPCFDSSCAVCTTGLVGLEICQLCKKGYTLGDDSKCYCNISNCEHCGENECLVCETGYIYNNQTKECEQIKEKIKCNDTNCDICYSELKGACVECRKGFYERKGECIKLEKANETGLCPYNFYNKNNYCLPICEGIDCPVKYDSSKNLCPSNKCLVCVNNVLKIWAECDNSEECTSIEGCLNCVTNDECVFCNNGYYLLGGLCYKCIEGCSICYNNYSCEYCLSGFELTSDKKCNLTYNFDFDIEEYNNYKEKFLNKIYTNNIYLPCYVCNTKDYCKYRKIKSNFNEEYCMQCPNNCLDCYYYGHRKFCTECENGFQINNEIRCSLICTDENCLECDLNYIGEEYCDRCKDGYKKNKEKCSTCSYLEGCSDCYFEDGKEYCSSCYNDGYMPYENKCIKCSDEKCLSCRIWREKEECTRCEEGYGINKEDYGIIEEKCLQCSKNCSHCYFEKGIEKCTTCNEGYGLTEEGKCLDCKILDENCKSCDLSYFYYIYDRCLSCENGYYLNEYGECSLNCTDKNCLSCSMAQNIEICYKCQEGYKLENGKCIKCQDINCLKCDEDKMVCTECNN